MDLKTLKKNKMKKKNLREEFCSTVCGHFTFSSSFNEDFLLRLVALYQTCRPG